MRRPLVIYDFATALFWISLYMRKILYSFLSVHGLALPCRFYFSTSGTGFSETCIERLCMAISRSGSFVISAQDTAVSRR
jgi:hypothetical protein